jgi:hypothetical protein
VDALVERKFSELFLLNLDPPKKLYDNLRRLGFINGCERFNGDVDVERLSSFFLRDRRLSTGIDFDVPEFSFVSVTEDEVFNAVMSIKSNAAGVDEIPLLPYLFGISGKVGASVVLPIPRISVTVKFSDHRPISLMATLSKEFEVLMARQMEAHIRRNELFTVFQSGFRRHHSTTAAVLRSRRTSNK